MILKPGGHHPLFVASADNHWHRDGRLIVLHPTGVANVLVICAQHSYRASASVCIFLQLVHTNLASHPPRPGPGRPAGRLFPGDQPGPDRTWVLQSPPKQV